MAKISAHGDEIARYFVNGTLRSARSDCTVLQMSAFNRTWKLRGRKKAHLSLEEWTKAKLDFVETLPMWARKVKSIPSQRQLETWVNNGVCGTPTGHRVEPDGCGPDGVPSWLLLLGMV